MWYFKTIVFTLMSASFGAAHGQVDERQLLSAKPNLGVVTRATRKPLQKRRHDAAQDRQHGLTGLRQGQRRCL